MKLEKGDIVKTALSENTTVLDVKDNQAILFSGTQFVLATGIKENKESGKFEWDNGRYANDLKSISDMQNNNFETMKETLLGHCLRLRHGHVREDARQLPARARSRKLPGVRQVDSPVHKRPIEDWNGSWTSYYEKKMIDTSIDAANYPQLCPYPYIRLAEMYLIAAEACTELNQLDEAAAFLDVLRARTGRPDTKATLNVRKKNFDQAAMREFLRHERRTELFMEDSRSIIAFGQYLRTTKSIQDAGYTPPRTENTKRQ